MAVAADQFRSAAVKRRECPLGASFLAAQDQRPVLHDRWFW